MFTTWEINFEFVAEKSSAVATLMHIASFLHHEEISFEVINAVLYEEDFNDFEAALPGMKIAAIPKVLSCLFTDLNG